MNVNMLEHQRSILATLGIDIWVPQAEYATRHYSSQLYRDQAPQPDSQPILFDSALAETIIPAADSSNQTTHEALGQGLFKRSPLPIAPQNEDPAPSLIQDQVVVDVEGIPVLQIPAFKIQALVCRFFVVLIDATELTKEQQNLWSNIQRAVAAEQHDLKWPAPFSELQDGRGASFYVQGFIDVLKNEKKVITLGKIPYFKTDECIELADLQQMLEQPILKRRLWHFIRQ